jgi:pentatricopeptide repeat protein
MEETSIMDGTKRRCSAVSGAHFVMEKSLLSYLALSGPYYRFISKINNQILKSNLSSDLITLGGFLRSSKHVRHVSPAFGRMVPVISRLIDHYKTPQTILSELQSIGSINLSTTNTNPNPFIHLLRIFSHAGNHIMVIETCQHMIEFHGFVIGKETFISNLLMESLFKTSQPEHAFYVFEQTKYPNFLTFNIALYHLSNINDIVNVSYVLRHMLSLHYCPNHNTFSAVLDSFCRMNAFRQVYQILGLMVGLGIELSINVWTVLINKFCKLRRLDVATNLFYKMIRTGCSRNVFTYTALIKAFIESNMVNDALHLLNNMLSDGLDPDLVLHNVLIDCFSKAGMYEDAFLAFGGLAKQINIKPDLYAYT